MESIGVLGSGVVGRALAAGFLHYGRDVMVGTRNPDKLADWRAAEGKSAQIGDLAETAAFGEILVIAVNGGAARDVISSLAPDDLAGKVIIDATNPVQQSPPVNGVISYFTDQNGSLMEALQALVPVGRFVKAFSCVGSAYMVNPSFPGGPPTMFICGNDPTARAVVTDILTTFGWDVEDMGNAEAARAIEPLAMLYCIPGIREHRWSHAFKLLRA